MRYKIHPQTGDSLSVLGFGFMRIGRDEQEAERVVQAAIAHGVNYFDTAYIYPGNEALLGRVLERLGARDQVRIATKLPPYLVRRCADAERIFAAQLARLKTERIDHYLIHMLPNAGELERLQQIGVIAYLERLKRDGQIGTLGFSYHGGLENFTEIIDAYRWGFCMLQYNYYDEGNQAGRDGVRYAAARGVPVMAMEPLRGGTLAGGLPVAARDALGAQGNAWTPAEWGFRWLWDQPELQCVVSGMTTEQIVAENARVASDAVEGALSDAEHACLREARDILRRETHVPCTGCNYCMPCPFGVDIPMCFSCYNDMKLLRPISARLNYVLRTDGHSASRCTACGRCVARCPQAIDIPAALSEVRGTMERFPFRPARAVIRRVMRLGKQAQQEESP